MLWRRLEARVALGVGCALLLTAPFAGSAAAIGVSSSKCRPVGSKMIALEPRGRVYSLPLRGRRREASSEDVRVIGCLFSSGHALRLGTSRGALSGLNPLAGAVNPKVAAITAPFAAYSTSVAGIDFNRIWAIVRNLNTGEVLQTVNASPKVGVEPESSVTDMAVTHFGSVAWISQGRSFGSGNRNSEVALSTPGKPAEILEESDGITPDSLELHGSRLTWVSEGVRRSAEMP